MLTRTDDGWAATTADDARAVLSDERLIVPPVPDEGPAGGIRRLRAAVSRFAEGAQHGQRRRLLETELARIDPAELGRTTGDYAEQLRKDPNVARRAPTAALAEHLGAADPLAAADAVLQIAPAYFPAAGAEAEAVADATLPRLRNALGGASDDTTTARITLLLQACEATGALVEATLGSGLPLDDVLRRRPPLPALRRVAAADALVAGTPIRAGEPVIVDVVAASDPEVVTFGLGRRPCPARAHALAAAAAVLAVPRAAPG